MLREIKEQKAAYFGSPPRLFFVRLICVAPVLPPSEITRETPVVAISAPGVVAMAQVTSIRKNLWADKFLPDPPAIVAGELAQGVVVFGRGEKCNANVDEVFIFVCLPAECAGLAGDERDKRLVKWVFDLVTGEGLELQRQGSLREQELRAKHPARIEAHEAESVDHYKNHAAVGLDLLACDYPHLAEVAKQMDTSQVEGVPEPLKLKRLKALLLDHKRHSGKNPTVAPSEAQALLGDDAFLRDLIAAGNSKGGTSALKWQIWQRWMIGDYYQMQPTQFEEAFARDWTKGRVLNSGKTLTKTANRMGLKSALKKGP